MNKLKGLKLYLEFSKIPAHLQNRYQAVKNDENTLLIKIISIFFLIFGSIMFLQHYFVPGVDRESFGYLYYQFIYIYCISLSVLSWLIMSQLDYFSTQSQTIILYVQIVASIQVGVALVLGDLYYADEFTA